MICSYQPEPGEPDSQGRYVFRCTNKGCGNAMRAKAIEELRPSLCKGPECIHLGEPTEETVTCRGCAGSKREHAVWTCAVVNGGKCLPTVRRTKPTSPAVHYCDGCSSREVTRTQT